MKIEIKQSAYLVEVDGVAVFIAENEAAALAYVQGVEDTASRTSVGIVDAKTGHTLVGLMDGAEVYRNDDGELYIKEKANGEDTEADELLGHNSYDEKVYKRADGSVYADRSDV